MAILERLRSVLGLSPAAAVERATPSPRPRPNGRIVPELPLYLQIQRIGGNLTPHQVSEIIRQADVGYMWRLIDLANEARQKDCHLQSVLQTRELALTGLPWQVTAFKTPNAKKGKKRDQKAADFVTECLSQVPDLSDVVAHITGANYLGYAVSEIVYAKDGAYVVPAQFQPISARRFVFDLEHGTLRWCDINGGMPYPGIDLRTTYPAKFLQFQPRVNGDVPCREGLVRVLMWAALFRNWTTRDWLALAELAWKPWRTGQYKKTASKEDIDNLEAILDAMSASGVATYPETTEVKVEWPKNAITGTSAHHELFDTLGAEMSKAVLGQTLTTEQGSRGSHALGRVHDNVRKDILEADARAVAGVVNRDLIVPLVKMNFGDVVSPPRFEFITEDAQDLAQYSGAILNLRKAGLRIPAKPVRDTAGIPEPDEGEETLGDADERDESDGEEPEAGVDNEDATEAPQAPEGERDAV